MSGAPTFAEGRITHQTIGRMNLEVGKDAITVRLWQWSLKPDATLSVGEAEELVRRLTKAIAQAKGQKAKRTSASDAMDDDDFSDIA